MACPFFEPLERFQQATTRVPLGDLWRGVCRTEPTAYAPDDSRVSELCNMGYARGRCPRYPQAGIGDAVRFLISRDQDALIRIEYVVERDHHPGTNGTLVYNRGFGSFTGAIENAILARQALAYVTSYLRRRAVAA